jgi:hypothetical protein
MELNAQDLQNINEQVQKMHILGQSIFTAGAAAPSKPSNELTYREKGAAGLFANALYNFFTAANLNPSRKEFVEESVRLYQQIVKPSQKDGSIEIFYKDKEIKEAHQCIEALVEKIKSLEKRIVDLQGADKQRNQDLDAPAAL